MGFIIKNNILNMYNEEGETDIVIPDNVTKIMGSVFRSNKNLKSVVIPEGMTTIEPAVFYGCVNLEKIVLPKSVEKIRSDAFYGTKWLEEKRKENPFVIVNDILIDCKNCEGDIIIPEGVKVIASGTFHYCQNITGIVMPESVLKIDMFAFYGIESLKSIVIPKNVIEIEENAFLNCINLENIVIPDSVRNIGFDAFKGTKWFEEKKKENDFVILNDILIYASTYEREVKIPEEINIISDGAFFNCDNLKVAILPENFIEIGCSFDVNVIIVLIKKDVKMKVKLLNSWDLQKQYLKQFMIDKTEENFAMIEQEYYKIITALLMLLSDSDKNGIYADFIKLNIEKTVKYLIDMEDIENLIKLLPFGFVTAENIDKLVIYANEKKQTEMQIKLMNYKCDVIGYKDIFDEFKI